MVLTVLAVSRGKKKDIVSFSKQMNYDQALSLSKSALCWISFRLLDHT